MEKPPHHLWHAEKRCGKSLVLRREIMEVEWDRWIQKGQGL